MESRSIKRRKPNNVTIFPLSYHHHLRHQDHRPLLLYRMKSSFGLLFHVIRGRNLSILIDICSLSSSSSSSLYVQHHHHPLLHLIFRFLFSRLLLPLPPLCLRRPFRLPRRLCFDGCDPFTCTTITILII